jgi:hypothetical protein
MNSDGGSGGEGVETLRAEYAAEYALEIPGRSRRLVKLLGRVMRLAHFHACDYHAGAPAYYALGGQIATEILERARATATVRQPMRR